MLQRDFATAGQGDDEKSITEIRRAGYHGLFSTKPQPAAVLLSRSYSERAKIGVG
jgi:hypothetical protein